jgi:hypothetical protein
MRSPANKQWRIVTIQQTTTPHPGGPSGGFGAATLALRESTHGVSAGQGFVHGARTAKPS